MKNEIKKPKLSTNSRTLHEFPDLALNFQAGEFYFKRSEFLSATLEIFVPTIEHEMEHVIN